jgi:tetratricopeptide (TPR) repeat protein
LKEDKLQKRTSDAVKEKVQYALGFGVIGMLLMLSTGLNMLLIIILGIFGFLLWQTISAKSPHQSLNEIFAFYLQANEILRNDDRKWFGFEIQEAIWQGERILQMMPDPPPLVHFTLGSLYHKLGNHKVAVQHLSYVLENQDSDEKNRSIASPELRNYVKTLRKIEQNPAEAPLMSAATRSLERARKNRGEKILEESRQAMWALEEKEQAKLEAENQMQEPVQTTVHHVFQSHEESQPVRIQSVTEVTDFTHENENEVNEEKTKRKKKTDTFKNRPTISEVLHDIYDQ